MAAIPEAHALIVGDLADANTHAWLEGGIRDGKAAPDLDAWRAALQELTAWTGYTVYGGRGDAVPVMDAVRDQTAYLTGMEKLVRTYVEGLGPRRTELAGNEAGAHYKRISTLAAEAYPERSLSYLVEYGVYGLVNRVAAERP